MVRPCGCGGGDRPQEELSCRHRFLWLRHGDESPIDELGIDDDMLALVELSCFHAVNVQTCPG